jgi:plastin-1
MSGYVGILVSDPWLQNQFTQVELRSLKTHVRNIIQSVFCFCLCNNVFVYVQFMSMRRESGKLTVGELASKMSRLKVVGENLTEEERASFIQDFYPTSDQEVDFELFLRVSVISLSRFFKYNADVTSASLLKIYKILFFFFLNFF